MFVHLRITPLGFPLRTMVGKAMVEHRASRFPRKRFLHMLQVYDPAESNVNLPVDTN